jgi:hypothetical protein
MQDVEPTTKEGEYDVDRPMKNKGGIRSVERDGSC